MKFLKLVTGWSIENWKQKKVVKEEKKEEKECITVNSIGVFYQIETFFFALWLVLKSAEQLIRVENVKIQFSVFCFHSSPADQLQIKELNELKELKGR